MSKKMLLLWLLLAGCSASKKANTAAQQGYYPVPVDQVMGHLNLSGASNCLYVAGDSLYFISALRAYGLQTDLAATEAQLAGFQTNPDFTALALNQVLLSKGGLRTEQTYARILIDRSKEDLKADELAALINQLLSKLDNEGILVLISPKQDPKAGQITQKANLLLTEAGGYRKSSLDTSLAPHLQALILLK